MAKQASLIKKPYTRFLFLGLIILLFLPLKLAHAGEAKKMILFGPYASLSAGEYKIAFSIKIDRQVAEPVVKIDVVANSATKVFTSQEIKGTDFKAANKYQNFDLYFNTTGEKDFEFRVKLLRDSNISIDKVGITQLKKWPVEQIVGGNMLKGSSKVEIIADEDSLLGSSKFIELKTNDPRFKRNAGWSEPELEAQVGQTTEPVSLPNKASLPKTTIGFVLFLIIIFIVSCAFILAGIFILKGDNGQNDKPAKTKVRGRRNLSSLSPAQAYPEQINESLRFAQDDKERKNDVRLRKDIKQRNGKNREIYDDEELGKSRIAVFLQEIFNNIRNLSPKHFIILGLLNIIIIFIFFENTSLLSSSKMIGYLLVLYVVLSLIWKINSKISITAALLLLLSCSFFLISAQEQLAENIAVYTYYFLVAGVILQLREHMFQGDETSNENVTEQSGRNDIRRMEEIASVAPFSDGVRYSDPAESSDIHGDERREMDSSSGSRYRVDELRRKKRKVKRQRLIILIILLSIILLATGIFLWTRFLNKPEEKNKSAFQSPVKISDKRLSEKRKELSINKSKIKIEVLNGNGVKGKALIIGDLLKTDGFNVLNTGNADNFNYAQTVIRHKKEKKKIADLVVKVISSSYSPVFQEDMADTSKADIIIILGKK